MDKNEANKESNRQKIIAGQNLDKLIVSKLDSLVVEGVIRHFDQDLNFSHKDYSYKHQFLADFVIQTSDLKYIVVRSSNSFRGDRVKIPFYDLDGIYKHSDITDNIIASVFLVPDEELNNTTFISTREKFKNKEYYSPATHLLVISEFIEFLENYAYEILQKKSNSDEKDIYDAEAKIPSNVLRESPSERGSYFGVEGNMFEKHIEKELGDPTNLISFRNGLLPENHIYSVILKGITSKHTIETNYIASVKATNCVPLLKSGGNPKTDLIVLIQMASGNEIVETISVKNTTSNWVSCHDYKARDFCRVMLCEGGKLEGYFNHFQDYPSMTDFIKNLKPNQSVEEFTQLLNAKKKMFSEWVLMGEHDHENIIDPSTQISRFLLIRHNGELRFYKMDLFIQTIFNRKNTTFGLPFAWTYPSKQRGKRIQLKVPVKN